MPYFVDFVDACSAVETLTITEPSVSSLCIPDGQWNQAKQLTLVMEELTELRVGDGALCVFDAQTMIRWRIIE